MTNYSEWRKSWGMDYNDELEEKAVKKIKKITDESMEETMDWVFQQEAYDELYPEQPIEL